MRRTSKPSRASFTDEISPICRMCLSADGALQPITSDERGAYLLQKILAYTDVEMNISDKFPSYLCSACKSRLDSFDKFRCLSILKNEKVERFREVLDTTPLTAAEHPDDIHQTDGVESVSVKTEVIAPDCEKEYQSSQTVSNSQLISSTYDYYHNEDLFEAEEESLKALLKREPTDEEQQLQLSDADLKYELKTDPSNFNYKVEGDDSMAEKTITSPDDSVLISDQKNSYITHTVEASAEHPEDIHQTDGVESVSVKTEVVAPDCEEDYQSSQTVSNSQLISSQYDYYHNDDLFEAEEESLEAVYKREPMDEEQQLQLSDADLKHELKTDPSNFNYNVEEDDSMAGITITSPDDCILISDQNNSCVTHGAEGLALGQMDPEEDSGYPCHPSVSTVDEQQLLPLNEHKSPQQDVTVAELQGSTNYVPKVTTDVHRIKYKHQCPHCSSTYPNASKLMIHLRTHTGEKPFQCKICDKAFHSKNNLRYHIKIHKKDQHHQCPQCPKKFAMARELKEHIRTHTGEKPFQCKVCDKAFHSKHLLAQHTRIHNKDQHHQCPKCPQKFAQLMQLKNHIRTHTGEKPFQCKVCGKAFHSKYVLAEHTRIHNKDQQHQCPQCPKKFAQLTRLKDHIRTHTGEKPFQCEDCGKAFHAKNSLRLHIKIHQKDQHHQCPQCPRKFVRPYKLKIHLRNHTGE